MSYDMTSLGLPAEITDKVEFEPVEELILRILRDNLPNSHIGTLLELDRTGIDYSILVRRIPGLGAGDNKWINYHGISVHVYTKDPDGDEKGALISDAVRVILRDAAHERVWYPDLGGLTRVRMTLEPVRKTDWATAEGPVQFADLPTGEWRYETRYAVWVRRPY